jgi:hypothetical protein
MINWIKRLFSRRYVTCFYLHGGVRITVEPGQVIINLDTITCKEGNAGIDDQIYSKPQFESVKEVSL